MGNIALPTIANVPMVLAASDPLNARLPEHRQVDHRVRRGPLPLHEQRAEHQPGRDRRTGGAEHRLAANSLIPQITGSTAASESTELQQVEPASGRGS